MKPNSFEFYRPENLENALRLLHEKKDDAILLAGGQSLIPMMNMRLINSKSVIDLSALRELNGVTVKENKIRIGAMTRYFEIKKSEIVNKYCPLLVDAIDYIAHTAVRNRGTLGGTLALSHPSAELPGCLIALNAEVVVQSALLGERKINVEDFIQGMMSTKLMSDEIITSVEFFQSNNTKHWFGEVSRRQGDFCTAAVAINTEIENKKLKNIRIVLIGVSNKPTRMTELELFMLNGNGPISIERITSELTEKIEFIDDIYNSANGKKHVSSELLFEGVNNFENKF